MTNGLAIAILEQINSEKYSINEKGLAIYKVLSMETINGITKAQLKKALMWLWHQHFEMADPVDILEEE